MVGFKVLSFISSNLFSQPEGSQVEERKKKKIDKRKCRRLGRLFPAETHQSVCSIADVVVFPCFPGYWLRFLISVGECNERHQKIGVERVRQMLLLYGLQQSTFVGTSFTTLLKSVQRFKDAAIQSGRLLSPSTITLPSRD